MESGGDDAEKNTECCPCGWISIAFHYTSFFLVGCLENRMNQAVNESPQDYIECTVTDDDKQLLITKVLTISLFITSRMKQLL